MAGHGSSCHTILFPNILYQAACCSGFAFGCQLGCAFAQVTMDVDTGSGGGGYGGSGGGGGYSGGGEGRQQVSHMQSAAALSH